MDKVRVYYDAAGHTLCVWLDDPALQLEEPSWAELIEP